MGDVRTIPRIPWVNVGGGPEPRGILRWVGGNNSSGWLDHCSLARSLEVWISGIYSIRGSCTIPEERGAPEGRT
jgi:hypothetical protein